MIFFNESYFLIFSFGVITLLVPTIWSINTSESVLLSKLVPTINSDNVKLNATDNKYELTLSIPDSNRAEVVEFDPSNNEISLKGGYDVVYRGAQPLVFLMFYNASSNGTVSRFQLKLPSLNPRLPLSVLKATVG